MPERLARATFERVVEVSLGQKIRPFPKGEELLPDKFGCYQSPDFRIFRVGAGRVVLTPIMKTLWGNPILRMARTGNRTIWEDYEPEDYHISIEIDFERPETRRYIHCLLHTETKKFRSTNSNSRSYLGEPTAILEVWREGKKRVRPSVRLNRGFLKTIALSFNY